jgi:anti-sigma B factor antagonist
MTDVLDVHRTSGVEVVSLGRHRLIEGLEAQEVGMAIMALADRENSKAIVIDFAGVDFVSSAFVGTLVDLHRKLVPMGVVLRLSSMCPNVHKIFQVTRLDRLFNIDRSSQEAVAAASRGVADR